MWVETTKDNVLKRLYNLELTLNQIYELKIEKEPQDTRTNCETRYKDGFWFKKDQIEDLEHELNTYKLVDSWSHSIPESVSIQNNSLKTTDVGVPLTEFILYLHSQTLCDDDKINNYLDGIDNKLTQETIGLNYKFETILSKEEKKLFEKVKYKKEFNISTNKTLDETNYFSKKLKNCLSDSSNLNELLDEFGNELNKQSELFGMFESDRLPKHLRISLDESDKVKITHIDFGSGKQDIPIQMQAYRISDAYIPYGDLSNSTLDTQLFYDEELKSKFLVNGLKYIHRQENSDSKIKSVTKNIFDNKNIGLVNELSNGIGFCRAYNNIREIDYLISELESDINEGKKGKSKIQFKAKEFKHHYQLAIQNLNGLNEKYTPLKEGVVKQFKNKYLSLIKNNPSIFNN